MKEKLLLTGMLFLFLFTSFAWANGQQPTDCDLDEEGCTFTITLNIAFDSGADDTYIWNAKNEIEDFWNNAGGAQPTTGECKCEVKFVVNTKKVQNCDKDSSSEWHCIKVTNYQATPPVDTRGKKYMGYMYPPGVSTGQNLTGWWSDEMSRPAPGGGNYLDFAHEAGHLMGLEDGDGGIMSNTTPGQATQTQSHIDEIIRDVCKGKSCPDRCCCGNGNVDKDKGEQCDPLATPNGCGAGAFCCPYCCSCEQPQCDPTAGEYASKEDCAKNCQSTEATPQECVYNYYTGCWFCIPSGWASVYPETDPANLRGCGKCEHTKPAPAPQPPSSPSLVQKGVGEESVLDLSRNLASAPMLSSLFGNERANIYLADGTEYYAITQGGEVIAGGEGLLPDPTMNIYTDGQTALMLYYNDIGPTDALKRELVTYEGVGFFEGFKFWLSDFLFDWFVPYEGPGPNEPPEYVLAAPVDLA